jgi:hypothetical protein
MPGENRDRADSGRYTPVFTNSVDTWIRNPPCSPMFAYKRFFCLYFIKQLTL